MNRLLALILLAAAVPLCAAQPVPAPAARQAVDDAFVSASVASLQSLIAQKYFDEPAIPRINTALGAALQGGEFARARNLKEFADRLTAALDRASHDEHLVVTVSAPASPAPDSTQMTRAESFRLSNYGMKTAKILDGNVGYLEVTAFARANEGSEAVDAAMRFLAHTDAIVLDLRVNGGGSPGTALQLLSYFFTQPDLPLFSIVSRSGDPTVERTLRDGIAWRDESRPVYVLVSARTWSAGEGVPFLLQERHRARVFGEKTAGAANPAGPWPINDALTVTIPYGSIRSALGGKNWDGTGVLPDTPVSPAKALQAAYAQALEELLARSPDAAHQHVLRYALANAGR
ncbi:MAG: S41 family peptidase [Terracidiphilus sp.]